MEKQNNSAFQRVLAFALTLIMMLGMLPMNVIALDVDDRATVTPIGGGVAVDDGDGNITVTVTEAALDWRTATAEHGEGWWVGVCVNAPESMTEEELALATYTVDGGLPESFVTKSGGARYIQFWIPVTQEFLAAGVTEEDIYEFNWNGLGDNNQTVTLTVVPSENIVLNPKAPATYTVTDISENYGTVSFESTEITEGELLKIGITPNEGYQIREIRLNGVSYPVTGDEVWGYYGEFEVTSDIELEVVYTKLFRINVTYTGDGLVAVDGETVTNGGSVTVVEGTDTAVLVATPASGYRVAAITVDGETTTFNVHAYEHTEELTKDQSHTVVVTFVQSFHTVQIEETQNGTATADLTTVEHGAEAKITITPAAGYTVDAVTVNGTETTALSVLNDDQYVLTVSGITEDQTIQVTFKGEPNASDTVAALTVTSDMVRVDGYQAVYKNVEGGTTVLKTDRDGIRVTLATGAKLGGRDQQQIVVTESAEVIKVELFYQGENEKYPCWHRVVDVTDENKLHLVIDTQILLEVTLSTPDITGEEKDYYCNDITVNLKIFEDEPGTGIQLVEYYIYRGDDKGEPTTIYEYVDGEENQYVMTDLSFAVDAESNSGEDLQILVAAKDRAENVAMFHEVVHINYVQATVVFDNDGKQLANNGKYYRESREAVITITDDPDKFNPDGVQLNLAATNAQGQPIANAYTIGEWVSVGNQHTARVVFSADANYMWQSLTYRNKVGTELKPENLTVEDSFGTSGLFTVDVTDPTGQVGINGNFWGELLETITFGLYTNTYFDVVGSGTDDISPVTIEYYVHKDTAPLSEEVLAGVEFKVMTDGKTTINEEGSFAVYLKITDYAGNYIYISSDGAIVDRTAPVVTLIPEEPQNGFYNGDVEVALDISDGDGAGIASVEYWIEKDDVAGEPQTWTQGNILVKTVDNANYDVVVHVKVTDKAGNSTETEVTLSIDTAKPTITLTPEGYVTAQTIEKNGENVSCYVYGAAGGEEVKITPLISDVGDAGIESVEYKIEKDGAAGEYMPWTEGYILVNKEANNSSNVVVWVKATDKAGNVQESPVYLDIDIDPPKIHIETNDESNPSIVYFFGKPRQMTITVTDRDGHLVLTKDDVVGTLISVNVEVKDDNNDWIIAENPQIYYEITDFDRKTSDGSSDVTYTVKIQFLGDALYRQCKVGVKDLAGNQNADIEWADGAMPTLTFLVDESAAGGTITCKSTETGDILGSWDENSNGENRVFANESVEVEYTYATVNIVSLASVEYYLHYGDTPVENIEDPNIVWNDYNKWDHTLSPNQQVTVYLKLTDGVKNVAYMNTDRIILDNQNPSVGELKPKDEPSISITPEAESTYGYYTGDVKINIRVTDPIGQDDGPYSGLENVEITLEDKDRNPGVITKIPVENWTKTNDATGCTWVGQIEVNGEQFNSNNVEVKVVAEDKAGNKVNASIILAIDITAPKVKVEYDNDAFDSVNVYKAGREAKITVTERNFNAAGVELVITRNGEPIILKNLEWTKENGTSGDDTQYWTTVAFADDGEYTFEVKACKDAAGNALEDGVDYGSHTNPNDFTIDQTAPTIEVTYTNNDAQNDRYFKEPREAIITIKEQNFVPNRVEITQTAAQGGVSPNVAWGDNGDGTYTARLIYSVDGVYTFDISVTDAAGNVSGAANFGGSVAAKDFVIDTTYEDMVTIGSVENGKAYGYGETPIPTVQIEDINLDEYSIKLTGIQKDKTIDLTDDVYALLNAGAQEVNGTFDIFQVVQDLDGIYTLSVYGLDKAGNEDREEVIFTVNRFGSVYVYNDYLMGLIANGGAYSPKVAEDLVITEYNAVKLLTGSLVIEITCDGRPLENPIYEVTPEINDSVAVGESGWYQYRYTISKDNFTSDGVYKITISSKDAAGNVAENNNYEGMSITFRVDSTMPEITSIVGLEEAIIDATQVTVKYIAYDTLGLKSVQVYVDGVLVDEITDFSADLSNYSGSFSLTEKNAVQHVRIVVEDLSGNITDTDSEHFVSAYEFNKDVTVSTNIFVQWYANKGLFWGSIGGVAVVAGLVIFLIAKKRKKV